MVLIAEYGFHGTPMSKLADTAGVGVGTIYRYFDSKEELIHALYHGIKQEMHTAMLANYSADRPVREGFRTLWLNTLAYCLAHPREFKFTEQYAYSPFLRDVAKAIQNQLPTDFAEFIKAGYEQQIFKQLPPEILFSMMYGPIGSLANKHIAGFIELTEADKEAAMQACWDAVKL